MSIESIERSIGLKLKNTFENFTVKPFLFVGSGVSQRYLGLPDWDNLLRIVAESISSEEYYYLGLKNAIKEHHIEDQKEIFFPKLASLIESNYNKKFYSISDFEKDIKINYHNEIQRGISPFKLKIASLLKIYKYTDKYAEEEISLKKISNKISGIITTNYDDFFEKMFPDFSIYVSETELISSQLYYDAEIYKINGTLEKPDSIIINSADYEQRRNFSKYLSSKLLTLFVEYPIIFIGFSINDPEILRILDDLRICLSLRQRKKLEENMVFINWAQNREEQKETTIEKNGITMTSLTVYDYNILYNHIAKFVKQGINVSVLRRLKELVSTTMLNNDEVHNNVFFSELFDENIKADDLAIFIDDKKGVNKSGYGRVDYTDVLRKIVFSQGGYDSKHIVSLYLDANPKLSKHVPFYYFLAKLNNPKTYLNDKYIKSINDLFSPSLARERDTNSKIKFQSIKDVQTQKFKFSKEVKEVLLNINNFNLSEIEEYLKSTFEIFADKEKGRNSATNYKKIITAYDFLKNSPKI